MSRFVSDYIEDIPLESLRPVFVERDCFEYDFELFCNTSPEKWRHCYVKAIDVDWVNRKIIVYLSNRKWKRSKKR